MSISSETRKAGPYAGNGVTTNLPFSFKVFSTADVRVVQTDPVGAETDLTLTTHYTVSLNADQDANPGGTVVMVTAPATGYYTTLTSKVQNLQAVTITNLGGFYPKILNDALDRLTIMVQQVAEQVSRAVKVGISSSSTPDQLIDAINTAASTASAAATSASGSAASASASAASASASASAISTYPASVQSQAFTRFTAGGTVDAMTGTLSPAIASYTAGLRVTTTPGGANTVTGPTLNLNSLGAKTIKKRDASGSKVALVAGDYNGSGPFDFEYDGTDFVLLNPLVKAMTATVGGLVPTPPNNTTTFLRGDGTFSAPSSGITLGTAVAATSGTSIDFTSIPSGTKKITVTLQGVSTSGTSSVALQLGDSGGVETSGYAGAVWDSSSWAALSSNFGDNTAGASVIREGTFELTLVDASTNTWACTYMIGFSHSAGGRIGMGTKSLSATLDRVRLTTSGGSDTFDAGKANIAYQ